MTFSARVISNLTLLGGCLAEGCELVLDPKCVIIVIRRSNEILKTGMRRVCESLDGVEVNKMMRIISCQGVMVTMSNH